jgi:RimJ/RimL family protein N-acetyltransferase
MHTYVKRMRHKTLGIRAITEADFPAYYELSLMLDEETDFRLYEPGERPYDSALFFRETADFLKNPRSNIFLAEEDGKLTGYLQAIGRSPRRIRHVVSINVAILKAYTGQGLGGRLFGALEEWAWQTGIKRLDLSVMGNNIPAQKLYERLGFEREGLKRGSMFINGEYVDEYYMCKWLEGLNDQL